MSEELRRGIIKAIPIGKRCIYAEAGGHSDLCGYRFWGISEKLAVDALRILSKCNERTLLASVEK